MANDVVVYAAVTREGTTDLNIHDQTNYFIATTELDPGSVTWRRDEARGPFTHGAITVGAVKETTTMALPIRVYGTSPTDLSTKVDALIAAFSAIRYTLKLGFDGRMYTYVCGPADYGIGFVTPYLAGDIIPVTLQVPRQPNHVLGTTP